MIWALGLFGAVLGGICWRYLFGSVRIQTMSGLCMLPVWAGFFGFAPFWAAQHYSYGTELHILMVLWIWIALMLALSDARVRRLPDPLTLALYLLALWILWRDPNLDFVTHAVTAALAALGFYVLHLLYLARRGEVALGLGDVKLIAGLSALIGPLALPWMTLLAALGALSLSLLGAVLRGEALKGNESVAFGVYLCFATLLVWGVL